jgi:hypothetical protein
LRGRELREGTGRVRVAVADRPSREETGRALVEARAPQQANSMIFWEWLALELPAARQPPSSQIGLRQGPVKMAEASSGRVAPRVRDKAVVEFSGHFRIVLALLDPVKTAAVFSDRFRIGLVETPALVKAAAGFSGPSFGPIGRISAPIDQQDLGKAAAGFSAPIFGPIGRILVPIDQQGPGKMAAASNARS